MAAASSSGGMNFGGETSSSSSAMAAPVPSSFDYRPTASYSHAQQQRFDDEEGSGASKCCCCWQLLTSPFRCQNWTTVLFTLFVMVTFGWFAALWCITTFGVGVGFLIFFPIGPALMMVWVISWRYLGRMELFMQRVVLGERKTAQYQLLPVCESASLHQAAQQNWCSCAGFWTAFKLVVFHREAWSALAYFALVKLPTATFALAWTLMWVFAPLCLIFNFVLVASCSTCFGPEHDMGGDWGKWENTKWLFNSYKGSAVTAPVGYVMLCIGLYTLRRLVEASAKFALYMLASRADSRDNSPLLGVAVHQHANM